VRVIERLKHLHKITFLFKWRAEHMQRGQYNLCPICVKHVMSKNKLPVRPRIMTMSWRRGNTTHQAPDLFVRSEHICAKHRFRTPDRLLDRRATRNDEN